MFGDMIIVEFHTILYCRINNNNSISPWNNM